MIQRTNYLTTSTRGLQVDHPAMRLFQKAKQLGIWDPCAVDLTVDREHWQKLNSDEQDALINLSSLFQAGEEAVTLDLLPLIHAVADEQRLEEEMYLTSFLWEEAKHVETFHRFLSEIAQVQLKPTLDLSMYHVPSYRKIFYEELPKSLDRLRSDRSPAALADASVTYNMVVEGILAETGYHGYHLILRGSGIMPGMQQLISNTKLDESRHIAYGVFLLSRLVAEHGEEVWQAIERRLNELVTPAVAIIPEGLSKYSPVPFNLDINELVQYAMSQFQARFQRIERARRQSLAEVYRVAECEELSHS